MTGCALTSIAVAGSFTAIVDGIDMQDRVLLSELRLSICERLSAQRTGNALGRGEAWAESTDYYTGYVVELSNHLWAAVYDHTSSTNFSLDAAKWMKDEVVEGEDIQDSGFWLQMQAFAFDPGGNSYSMAYHHWMDPTGTITNGASVNTMDTWVELAAICGLTTNGFRRAVSTYPNDWDDQVDVGFSHGLCQNGDFIGPWLIKDLQTVLTNIHLLSAGEGSMITGSNRQEIGSSDADPDCATALTQHETAWAATSWASGSAVPAGRVLRSLGANYNFSSARGAGAFNLANVSVVANCVPYVYAVPTVVQTDDIFYDIEGYGFVEGNFFLVETLALSASTNLTSSIVGLNNASAVSTMGMDCSASFSNNTYYSWEYDRLDAEPEWLLDFTFTFE